ncbi:MAG: hypothetical protein KDB36_04260 [Acidimicrobiales bacterium]|nr:hypothetical protein [Acidimicrobiales bacterium]
MPVLTGPLDALAVVLFVAGIAKLARPDATVPALRAVRLPASALVVRLVGVLEVVAAATVLAFGGPVGAAAACVLYAAFAVFAAALLRSSGRDASCGCFGEASAPVTGVHVAVNVVAAAVAAAAIAVPVIPFVDAVGELGWEAPAFVLLVLVGGGLVRAALTVGAELQLAMGELRSAP